MAQTDIQPIVDQLLTAIVGNGDPVNLTKMLSQGFVPSASVDLITAAAAIGSERDRVLSVLLLYGVE